MQDKTTTQHWALDDWDDDEITIAEPPLFLDYDPPRLSWEQCVGRLIRRPADIEVKVKYYDAERTAVRRVPRIRR